MHSKQNIFRNVWIFWLPCLVLLLGCKKDEELPVVDEVTQKAIQEVYDIMNEWYFWNDELPPVEVTDYKTPEELLEALRKRPLDRWSYIEDAETYDQLFNQGIYKGYGVQFGWDTEGYLRIAYVYQDSPFYKAGVRRTWRVISINGISAENFTGSLRADNNTFVLEDTEGQVFTKNITAQEVKVNTVLYHGVVPVQGKKIGYLVFNSFLQTSKDELKPVFQEFQSERITELILDLRYNGGGRVNIAEYLAANIIGANGEGKNFYEYIYNEDKADENEAVPFYTPDIPLDLPRLFVIASKSTASASELIINGLLPFMDVVVIGDDTYGKPVGSFGFRLEAYVLNPICFAITNDDGYGFYFDGLKANAYVPDDLTRDLGDVNEARLKEALYYIETGNFSSSGSRARPSQLPEKKQWQPQSELQQVIGAF